ncbi:hypothetical protein DB31_5777 [Hyalangium minutum]|uniref:Uncharacterized protein n=1 Tax=Hyalangium minutum TaxID=394096 RepID=A0A085WSS2_9BACT|nr:hypothetical protein DB31_5777 [Hyalangium minutum]
MGVAASGTRFPCGGGTGGRHGTGNYQGAAPEAAGRPGATEGQHVEVAAGQRVQRGVAQ